MLRYEGWQEWTLSSSSSWRMWNCCHVVDVAQLVRVPDCGSGGRGFNSRHPPQVKSLLVQGFLLFWDSMSQWGSFSDEQQNYLARDERRPALAVRRYLPYATEFSYVRWKVVIMPANLKLYL